MSIRDMLVRHEGLRLRPYRDMAGRLTIGVGRNLDDVGITRDEAMILLDNDILRAQTAVIHALPWVVNLDQPRLDVLVNMTFNMGIGRVLGFAAFLSALERGDYEMAAREMLASKWATQVGNRAVELAEIMRTGVDPFTNGKSGSGAGGGR